MPRGASVEDAFVRTKSRKSRADADGGERAQRQCGPCTACCTVMGIASLHKPAGAPCPHLAAHGCGIYEDRPQVCRDFTCLWLADHRGLLAAEHRPDVVGLVLTEADHHDPTSSAIAAREVFPGAAGRPEAAALIAELRRFVTVSIVSAPGPRLVPLQIRGRAIAGA